MGLIVSEGFLSRGAIIESLYSLVFFYVLNLYSF